MKSVKSINYAIAIIEREQSNVPFLAYELWLTAIKAQRAKITQIQNYLIQLALYRSAKLLTQLNVELTEKSLNVLSLVRESLAKEAMEPYFIKANKAYQPYYDVNENLALVSSLNQRNSYAAWYKDWNRVEKSTLVVTEAFSNYPKNFDGRARELSTFTQNEAIIVLNRENSNLQIFMNKNPAIKRLIEKLKRRQSHYKLWYSANLK